jgi:NAD(P)-dependent dehydrogenase (short-subunit alcohol dehydrogenase family)
MVPPRKTVYANTGSDCPRAVILALSMNRFVDQVVLVTGAGHGIGRAVAERFASEGARVVVNDLDEARANEVARAIRGALGIAGDVAVKAQVHAMFDRVEAEFGPVDVLVNNAGNIYAARHFLEGDEAWWDQVLGVNLKGAFLCSHRAAPAMVRRRSGVILNMSSGGATRAHRGNVAYDASKGGIEAMTRAMALDLAPYGVRVNAIVPGLRAGTDSHLRSLSRSGSGTRRGSPHGALGHARGSRGAHRVPGHRRRAIHHRRLPGSGWRSARAAALGSRGHLPAQPVSHGGRHLTNAPPLL